MPPSPPPYHLLGLVNRISAQASPPLECFPDAPQPQGPCMPLPLCAHHIYSDGCNSALPAQPGSVPLVSGFQPPAWSLPLRRPPGDVWWVLGPHLGPSHSLLLVSSLELGSHRPLIDGSLSIYQEGAVPQGIRSLYNMVPAQLSASFLSSVSPPRTIHPALNRLLLVF